MQLLSEFDIPYRNYLVQITFLSFWMIKKWSIKITICSVSGVRMVDHAWKWKWSWKSKVGYSRLPTEFLILETELQKRWSSSVFPSVPNMFVKVVGIPAIFDDSQLLEGYHWHFHAYMMILSVMQLTIVWILKTNAYTHMHTHPRTRTRSGDNNLQYNISTELNILKCAYNFLKCMLWFVYPTIILELKSKRFFGTHGHKEQFYLSKVCSD